VQALILDAWRPVTQFRRICKAAEIGEKPPPRELRHSFVSITSDNGVPLERIADLVGHRRTLPSASLPGSRIADPPADPLSEDRQATAATGSDRHCARQITRATKSVMHAGKAALNFGPVKI
jgi:hypothetical protein